MSLVFIIVICILFTLTACSIYCPGKRIRKMKSRHISALMPLRPWDTVPILLRGYLKKCGVSKNTLPASVYLKQQGTFYFDQKAKGHAMSAEQYFNPATKEFIWLGRIYSAKIIPVWAEDSLLNGKGRLTVRIMGCMPVAVFAGPEITQGELIRYLAEMIWFPAAFLDPGIEYNETSKTSVTLSLKEHSNISLDIHFNSRGFINSITALRYKDKDLTHWEAIIKEYKEFNGIMVSWKCEVRWKLKSGYFTYYKLEITNIKYLSLV